MSAPTFQPLPPGPEGEVGYLVDPKVWRYADGEEETETALAGKLEVDYVVDRDGDILIRICVTCKDTGEVDSPDHPCNDYKATCPTCGGVTA